MNKKICLGTGFLALALLAGCSSNSNTDTSPVADGTITIWMEGHAFRILQGFEW